MFSENGPGMRLIISGSIMSIPVLTLFNFIKPRLHVFTMLYNTANICCIAMLEGRLNIVIHMSIENGSDIIVFT